MKIIGRFYSLAQSHALQNVASNDRDLQGVLEIVVECIAHPQVFNGTARQRAEALGVIIVGGAKNPPEIFGEEMAKFPCSDGRGGFHLPSPNDLDLRSSLPSMLQEVPPELQGNDCSFVQWLRRLDVIQGRLKCRL